MAGNCSNKKKRNKISKKSITKNVSLSWERDRERAWAWSDEEEEEAEIFCK